MTIASLQQVLEATGFFPDGQPAAGLYLGQHARGQRPPGRDFSPDALWRSPSSLTVYFKFENMPPSDELVSLWHREI